MQYHGDVRRPVSYNLVKFDPVALGFLPCTQILPGLDAAISTTANITVHQHVQV